MSLRVREAGADSVEALCVLFTEVFGQPMDVRQWRWKYLDPALPGSLNMVLEADSGILGHGGALLLDGVVDGRPVPMAQLCDVMLAPAARGDAGPRGAYALFMRGLIAALRQRVPGGVYFGFPGARPFRLGERLGFYGGRGPVREWRVPARKALLHRWQLRPLAWDDPALDRIWERHRRREGCMVVRNRRYLDWRYARHPGREYRIVGLRRGLALEGWLVLSVENETLRCVDRLIDERRWTDAAAALAGLAGSLGCTDVAFWGGDTSALRNAAVRDTGMIGVVLPASGPECARRTPFWQPGDTDVF